MCPALSHTNPDPLPSGACVTSPNESARSATVLMNTTDGLASWKIRMFVFSNSEKSPRGVTGRGSAPTVAFSWFQIVREMYHPATPPHASITSTSNHGDDVLVRREFRRGG